VNFVIFGLLTIAFAVGLHLGLRPTRWGVIGPSLLVLSGMALVWAAEFPQREDAAGLTYDPGLHIVGCVTYFLSSALGLIVVSRRRLMRRAGTAACSVRELA
jgi:drug/metabolite transporter (DMT)-like permease